MRVALVHDYLTQLGGAERVLDALAGLYRDAPVATSILDPAALSPALAGRVIRVSPLGRLPRVERYHRALLPLYPLAFRALDLDDADVLIADSSAWSHHAIGRPDALRICYCHSPARFLYRDPAYLAPARLPLPARLAAAAAFAALRPLDRRAARRQHVVLANSHAVAARVRAAWGIEAAVLHPPVDTDRFSAGHDPAPDDALLIVSRLVPHKRIDIAVDAATRAGLRLVVIGDGRSRADLERRAGPTVEFRGALPDDAVVDAMRRCRAFILPAAEDFGITAVEAQAAGRPVVAFAAGGALESVVPDVTGVFFAEPSADALLAAIDHLAAVRFDPADARANAARFARPRFQAAMADIVARAWEAHRRG